MSRRPASHAGQWYSADEKLLNFQLDEWLNTNILSEDQNRNSIKAIISPHAGYNYSGIVAASGFARLRSLEPKLIVILGPSHYKHLKNQCALSKFSEVRTPIGDLKIDADVNSQLLNSYYFISLSSDEDKQEHSLEMQFPLVSKIFGTKSTKIVPILVGSFTDSNKRSAAADLIVKSIPFEDVIFIISSDFCHYGSRFDYTCKFSNSNVSLNENISMLDRKGFNALNEPNPQHAFSEYLQSTKNTICGREAILLFLDILNQSNLSGRWELIDYAQSNILNSHNDNCVSYLRETGLRMSSELSEIFLSLNDIMQTLADSKDGQDLKIPAKLNSLVEKMKKAEDSFDKEFPETMVPISIINSIDKASSNNPIEDMLKKEFQETESITSELRELNSRFKELSDNIYK